MKPTHPIQTTPEHAISVSTPKTYHSCLGGLHAFRFGFRSLLALVVPGLILGGCTALQTTEQNTGRADLDKDGSDSVGLYYYLPKALIKIEGKLNDKSPGGYEVAVSKIMTADKRRQFHLHWKNNPLFDDTITTPINVNAQGLLTSVQFSSTDQTPAILNDLATTTVNVFKIMSGGPQSGTPGEKALVTPKPFSVTFDPLDASECAAARRMMKSASGADIQVCGQTAGVQSCIGGDLGGRGGKDVVGMDGASIAQAEKRGGVLFHPPTAVEMRFDFTGTNSSIIHREVVVVPDPARVACFRFGRSPFVNRTTALTLTDGMPTQFTLSRPSPMKGFTGMLTTVTGTIASAMPTLLNVKVNREINEAVAEKKLLDAQTSLAKAQKDQITAQRALDDMLGAQSGQSQVVPKLDSAGGNPLNSNPEDSPQSGDKPAEPKKLKIEGTVELPDV